MRNPLALCRCPKGSLVAALRLLGMTRNSAVPLISPFGTASPQGEALYLRPVGVARGSGKLLLHGGGILPFFVGNDFVFLILFAHNVSIMLSCNTAPLQNVRTLQLPPL